MKKILALLLVLIMSMSIVAGCGEEVGNDDDDGGSSGGKKAESEEQTQINDKISASPTLGYFAKTVAEISRESETANKNLYGFVPNEKEGSVEINMSVDDLDSIAGAAGVELPFSSAEVNSSMSWSLNKELVTMDMTGKIGNKNIDVMDFFWNDSNIGFASADLLSTKITVPTKTFGSEWNKSMWAEESGTTLPENLDISLGLINDMVSLVEDKSMAVGNATLDFLDGCDIEEAGTTEVEFADGSEDVDVYEMTISEEDVVAYVADLCDIAVEAVEDKTVKNLLGMFDVTTDDAVAAIEDFAKQAEEEIEFDDVTVDIWVYDGMVIGIAFEEVIESDEVSFKAYFTDPEYLLEGMNISMEVNDIPMYQMVYEGNLVSGGSRLEYNAYATASGVTSEMSYVFDYGTNEFEVSMSGDAMGEGVEIRMAGECYKKDGFKLVIREIEAPGMPGEANMIFGLFDMSVVIRNRSTGSAFSGGKNFFTMNQSDLENLATDFQENAMRLVEDLGLGEMMQ